LDERRRKRQPGELNNYQRILLSRADDMEKHTKDKRKMNNSKIEALKTMQMKVRSIKRWLLLIVLVLAAIMLAPHSAEASCPAPGTGLPGALNMMHDATMLSIPMTHDAAQGNAGMFHAVANTACP
jgi:hypothetical protein